ncbi:glycosyltransferase [Nocardioides sp. 503]|uniref:glycosyltransferase n=1 Tax=Nocardioides sp. 503 TaxID=2508326 RepID=UPI00106FC5CB|nr:glycosyltransferase [Nocardioides sp. 503]
MIGYYVHHHGHGHRHRALALAQALGRPVVGLSSAPAPRGWPGDWVLLPRDDEGGPPRDATAQGRLHWVPVGDEGLAQRAAVVSQWIADAAPAAMVVDVSVEMTLLARLHGVRVVGVVQPGRRSDGPHLLGFDVSDALVGLWPSSSGDMLPGVPERVRERVVPLGALSRHPVAPERPRAPGPPRVTFLAGSGGPGLPEALLASTRRQTPDWEWTVLGGAGTRTWSEDPRRAIEDADVVVTHAGQNALAEVAAARRPAVVVPEDRPFDEQLTTGAVLAEGWPAVVLPRLPRDGWPALLDRARSLDGRGWGRWCDGRAAERFAGVVEDVASGQRVGS